MRTEDGHIWCVGDGGCGQLGDGTTRSRTEPALVRGLAGAVSIGVGICHSCAVRADGSLWCWGDNGAMTTRGAPGPDSPTPVRVPLAVAVRQIAVARSFTCALGVDGIVYCWGIDSRGQLGDGRAGEPRGVTQVPLRGGVEIAADEGFACALLGSGEVWCWGQDLLAEAAAHGPLPPRPPTRIAFPP
ncbi:MAG: hypothetical protein HY909_25140 [Deltaproteobacteria bacterium]|nr:hypothetical protein [Deltaproteobacteria bacterium]